MTPKVFFGWVFIVLGALIALLAGVCTIVFLSDIYKMNNEILLVLTVGGVPFLLGLTLIFLGRYMRKS